MGDIHRRMLTVDLKKPELKLINNLSQELKEGYNLLNVDQKQAIHKVIYRSLFPLFIF